MGIQLIMTTVIASTVGAIGPGCSWAHPGANPFRGDPAAALSDFSMPEDTRRKLRASMATHRMTDVATITRDHITGSDGKASYADLRQMHSGHGQVCHGAVDRSAWSATRRERALVYCVDGTCILVPTICNNVSLVTRQTDEPGAGAGPIDDSPIDIAPAAGPPGGTPGGNGPDAAIAGAAPDAFIGAASDDVAITSGTGGPGDFTSGSLPSVGLSGANGGSPGGAAGGNDLGNTPGGGATSGDTGTGIGGSPTIPGTANNPGGGGDTGGGVDTGGGGCCAGVAPTTPTHPTPVGAVPEPSGGLLWMSGAIVLLARRWWNRCGRSA